MSINFPRRAAQDEAADSFPCHMDVLETSENVDLVVGDYNSRLASIFNGKFGFTFGVSVLQRFGLQIGTTNRPSHKSDLWLGPSARHSGILHL